MEKGASKFSVVRNGWRILGPQESTKSARGGDKELQSNGNLKGEKPAWEAFKPKEGFFRLAGK